MEPVEFGYPQADGVDILDNIRTNTGNEQGPLPQKELDAMTPSQLREVKNQRYEAQMGWAKPVAQFLNTISSPAVAEGMVIGPINAVSKLGNALGDVILRKEVDTSDAWQIDQDALGCTTRCGERWRTGLSTRPTPLLTPTATSWAGKVQVKRWVR